MGSLKAGIRLFVHMNVLGFGDAAAVRRFKKEAERLAKKYKAKVSYTRKRKPARRTKAKKTRGGRRTQ